MGVTHKLVLVAFGISLTVMGAICSYLPFWAYSKGGSVQDIAIVTAIMLPLVALSVHAVRGIFHELYRPWER